MNANPEPHEFIAAAISRKFLPFTRMDAAGDFPFSPALRYNLGRGSAVKTLWTSARKK